MLEINTNSLAYSVYTHLRKAEAQSTTALERLSSGKRINSGMDDAAGLTISNRLNVLTASIQMAIRNVNDAISLTQSAEAGIREIDSYLLRAKELVTQAQNDTLSSSAKSAILDELHQNFYGIAETVAMAKFNNVKLLSNSDGSVGVGTAKSFEQTYAVGSASTPDYANSSVLKLDVAESSVNSGDTQIVDSIGSLGITSRSNSGATDTTTTVADVGPAFKVNGSNLDVYFWSERDTSSGESAAISSTRFEEYKATITSATASTNPVATGVTNESAPTGTQNYAIDGDANGGYKYDIYLDQATGRIYKRDNTASYTYDNRASSATETLTFSAGDTISFDIKIDGDLTGQTVSYTPASSINVTTLASELSSRVFGGSVSWVEVTNGSGYLKFTSDDTSTGDVNISNINSVGASLGLSDTSGSSAYSASTISTTLVYSPVDFSGLSLTDTSTETTNYTSSYSTSGHTSYDGGWNLLVDLGTTGTYNVGPESNYEGSASGISNITLSPNANTGGTAAVVYTNSLGNLEYRTIDLNAGTISSTASLVNKTNDTAGVTVSSNYTNNATINLRSHVQVDAEDMYNMNTANESFRIYKKNEATGTSELLSYLVDPNGSDASRLAGGYYTVDFANNTVTFSGTARIGAESTDDGSSYYYIVKAPTNSSQDSNYHAYDNYNSSGKALYSAVSIPDDIELYNTTNLDSAPYSLKITVNGSVVAASDLLTLAERNNITVDSTYGVTSVVDSGVSTKTNGVYINETTREVELYGTFRPTATGSVRVAYFEHDIADHSDSLDTVTIQGPVGVDTYNLDETVGGVAGERALRVWNGNQEIPYAIVTRDSNGNVTGYSGNGGYIYDRATGKLDIYGIYRPDPTDTAKDDIHWSYWSSAADSSTTSSTVFGIDLDDTPGIYNLSSTDDDAPRSLRVYHVADNGTRTEIDYFDGANGYKLDVTNSVIQLYGTDRPDATESSTQKYEIYYHVQIDSTEQSSTFVGTDLLVDDDPFIINLSADAADSDYAYALDNHESLKVMINSTLTEIDYYDATAANGDGSLGKGYTFDHQNNRILIYGDSRPDITDNNSVELLAKIQSVESLTSSLQSSSSGLDSGYQIDLDLVGIELPAGYGIPPVSGESTSLAVYGKNSSTGSSGWVPYDATGTNGYDYDATSHVVTLYGDWRPTPDTASSFKIQTVGQLSLSVPLKTGSSTEYQDVGVVTLDGSVVPNSADNNGDGYLVSEDGSTVTLTGSYQVDAKTDVTGTVTARNLSGSLNSSDTDFSFVTTTNDFNITMSLFTGPGDITLTTSSSNDLPDGVTDWLPHLKSGVLEEDIEVYLNDQLIDASKWAFDGQDISIDFSAIDLGSVSSVKVHVDWVEYPPVNTGDIDFDFQVGTEADSNDTLRMTLRSFENLLIDLYKDTPSDPRPTIDTLSAWSDRIDAAKTFSFAEGVKVGAMASRLDYTLDNLLVSNENHQAARSRILDADYAVETANLARAQILSKAGYAMLAQAKNVNAHLVQTLLK